MHVPTTFNVRFKPTNQSPQAPEDNLSELFLYYFTTYFNQDEYRQNTCKSDMCPVSHPKSHHEGVVPAESGVWSQGGRRWPPGGLFHTAGTTSHNAQLLQSILQASITEPKSRHKDMEM